jgi:hypothetical protein
MKTKKIICIYLVLVMVLTGCGQFRRLTDGSDTTIKKQDENKNEKSGNNSGNAIVPQNPTPAPTPSLLASPTPTTGGKDKNKNKDAEHSLIDTAKDFARENPEIIGLFIFLAGIVWHDLRQNPQPAGNQPQANQEKPEYQKLQDERYNKLEELDEGYRQAQRDLVAEYPGKANEAERFLRLRELQHQQHLERQKVLDSYKEEYRKMGELVWGT